MAEVVVSFVLEQLATFAYQHIEQQWSFVSGVEEKLESLSNNLEDIQMVLVDADKRQIIDASVKRWLDKLKAVSYEIDTAMDEWNTAIALRDESTNLNKLFDKVWRFFFTLPCLNRNHDVHRHGLHRRLGFKIEKLSEKLNRISDEKERYTFGTTSYNSVVEYENNRRNNVTTSFVELSKVCGRDVEKKMLVEKLLMNHDEDESNQIITRKEHEIIPLVGMGGIGKTTLAQLVYNDEQVNAHFNLKIWVCVSDPFDEIAIAREICGALRSNNKDVQNLGSFDQLLTYIKESIVGRKFLLVLDDVWSEDNRKWVPLQECLKNGDEGSKILVTTRKKHVATMMKVTEDHIIFMERLSDEVCLSIFSELAFLNKESQGQEQLKEIGVKIAQKCKGLPLVARALGSLMRFRKYTKKHWNEVLHSELWELGNQVENEVFVPFLLSYYDLPLLEKRCLSYCSIFRKDYVIDRGELIQLWMSQGYLSSLEEGERKGIDCFENLATHSFFQEFETDEDGNIIRCKMHDIVHDFVLFLTKNECFNSVISSKDDGLRLLRSKAFHYILSIDRKNWSINCWEHKVYASIYKKRNIRTLSIDADNCSIKLLRWDLLFKLRCLRTLNLSGCLSELKSIPKDIDKLILLRYLNLSNNDRLDMPKTLGNMFNLQTLNLDNNRGWLPKQIGKLVNLQHLYLGDYSAISPKELGKLTQLQTLHTSLFNLDEEGPVVFQRWMTPFNNLKSLVLEQSEYAEFLGPLGKLRSLESLTLKHMVLRTAGDDFLGIIEEDTTTEMISEPFPKLKRLQFIDLCCWVEWKSCNVSSIHDDQIMPCLQSLHFEDCSSLKAPLPKFLRSSPVKALTIKNCKKLEPLLKDGLGAKESINILTSKSK